MGPLPLSFLRAGEERARLWLPLDRLQLAVPDDHPLDDDPAEFLASRWCRHRDSLRQSEDAGPVRIERPDPIAVRQLGEGGTGRVPLGLVLRVGQVTPAVLLLQLLEAGEEPCALAAGDRHLRGLQASSQLSESRAIVCRSHAMGWAEAYEACSHGEPSAEPAGRSFGLVIGAPF